MFINDRSNGPPLSVSQRQMFWSKETMAAYPRARLRAWSKRARISCAAERRKWSTSHQNHKPPAILLMKNTNMSPKPLTPEVLPILNGTGENTSNYTSNDMQYPNYPIQRPPTLQLDGELRSISSISFTPSASSSHSHSRSPSCMCTCSHYTSTCRRTTIATTTITTTTWCSSTATTGSNASETTDARRF